MVITLNDQPLLFRVIRSCQETALSGDGDFAAIYNRCLEEGGKPGRSGVFDFRFDVLCRLVGETYVPILPSTDR